MTIMMKTKILNKRKFFVRIANERDNRLIRYDELYRERHFFIIQMETINDVVHFMNELIFVGHLEDNKYKNFDKIRIKLIDYFWGRVDTEVVDVGADQTGGPGDPMY